MKIKSTLKSINWKNTAWFAGFVVSSGVALTITWRLIVEPFYTQTITTLTWFGVWLYALSIVVSILCWVEFWGE